MHAVGTCTSCAHHRYAGAKNDMWKKVITEFEEILEILYQYHSNQIF